MTEPIITRTFTASITDADGIRIDVKITVPVTTSWQDVFEASEISQLAAARAAQLIAKRPTEVPF